MPELFYVIGPSGAGKDSVMLAARQALDGAPVLFAHRYVTRPFDAGGENFVSLSEAEFDVRLTHGLLWLHWRSHELNYGIGAEVLSWLQAGLTVVVNGSREALPQVEAACVQAGVSLTPVWVQCDLAVLAERLRARGRETPEQIAERLARAGAFAPPSGALVLDNSGTLAQTLAQWLPRLQRSLSDAP